MLILCCEAQNLVYNPSFEEIDSCPQLPILGFGPGERPNGWFCYNGTPDYFNRCQPYGSYGGVPLNIGGWQPPVQGDAYSGMWSYSLNTNMEHEMIATELLEPLMVGATYYVSFYINAAAGGSEWPMLASSHYGALFTMAATEWEVGMALLPLLNVAHVFTPVVRSDTAAWSLVSGSFVADSAYRYMVLGNHFDNTYTEADTIIMQDSLAFLYRSYTYVDQVCVSLDPMGCPLAQEVSEHGGSSVLLYPNPAVGEVTISGLQSGFHVRVYDAVGRSLWQGLAQGVQLKLDVGQWSRGWYTAVIQDKQGSRSKKFVLIE